MKKQEHNEILESILDLGEAQIVKSAVSSINALETKRKLRENLIKNHLSKEPYKIFKKRHNQWKQELDKLNSEYDKVYNDYLDECVELENMLDSKKSSSTN